MAVYVCSSASEPFISPRISFSYDLNTQSSDTDTSCTIPNTTFDFCISFNRMQHITSADELFFDGVLLPTQTNKPQNHGPQPKPTPTLSQNEVQKKRLKDLLLSDNDQQQAKPSLVSFWKFSRSSSLNSDNGSGGGPKRLFRSLSLKLLLRSSSTELNPTGNEAIKKSKSRKEPGKLLERCCSSSIQSPSINYSCRRWSVTKQNSGGGYDGRIKMKMNPVLNLPPPYFGSGSLFCNGKSRNKTK